ncbi:hypothetical protein QWA68_011823 [Fusarium oxysporum]|nr:hypothetical protein QWA68_011823 [Fusarium oxysporum]
MLSKSGRDNRSNACTIKTTMDRLDNNSSLCGVSTYSRWRRVKHYESFVVTPGHKWWGEKTERLETPSRRYGDTDDPCKQKQNLQ